MKYLSIKISHVCPMESNQITLIQAARPIEAINRHATYSFLGENEHNRDLDGKMT